MEIVRRYYERLAGLLDEYWADPVPFEEWDRLDEVLAGIDPDAEWYALTRRQPARGHRQWVQQVNDWLEANDEWRIAVEGVEDLDDDRVLVTSMISVRGKGSGIPIEQRVFSVVTTADGAITRIRDHLDRAAALEDTGP